VHLARADPQDLAVPRLVLVEVDHVAYRTAPEEQDHVVVDAVDAVGLFTQMPAAA
jgi:hypothetical protein